MLAGLAVAWVESSSRLGLERGDGVVDGPDQLEHFIADLDRDRLGLGPAAGRLLLARDLLALQRRAGLDGRRRHGGRRRARAFGR